MTVDFTFLKGLRTINGNNNVPIENYIMKQFTKTLTMLIIFAFASCNNKNEKKGQHTDEAGNYEISGIDTINFTDLNGFRQGLWLMPISKDTVVYYYDTAFSANGMTSGEVKRNIKKWHK